MFKIIIKNFLFVILISIINKQAIAITGEEISTKVTQWLTKEGIEGIPVFSKKSFYKDCNNEIEIKKMYQNYNLSTQYDPFELLFVFALKNIFFINFIYIMIPFVIKFIN